MNICKVCDMGYCPNRIKRVFGYLPAGYCSPQCFTKDRSMAAFQREKVAEKYDAKVLAGKIIDALSVEGYISDDLVTSPDRFAEIVETIEPLLKPL
jgi:hypothetical protein